MFSQLIECVLSNVSLKSLSELTTTQLRYRSAQLRAFVARLAKRCALTIYVNVRTCVCLCVCAFVCVCLCVMSRMLETVKACAKAAEDDYIGLSSKVSKVDDYGKASPLTN